MTDFVFPMISTLGGMLAINLTKLCIPCDGQQVSIHLRMMIQTLLLHLSFFLAKCECLTGDHLIYLLHEAILGYASLG